MYCITNPSVSLLYTCLFALWKISPQSNHRKPHKTLAVARCSRQTNSRVIGEDIDMLDKKNEEAIPSMQLVLLEFLIDLGPRVSLLRTTTNQVSTWVKGGWGRIELSLSTHFHFVLSNITVDKVNQIQSAKFTVSHLSALERFSNQCTRQQNIYASCTHYRDCWLYMRMHLEVEILRHMDIR